MKTFALPCFDHCKSFYNKAICIEHDDGTKELYSYNTFVCKITPDGNFYRTWDGNTRTTNRHIKSFKKFYDIA